ncbi:MAG: hypothetical protein JWN16_674 [Alphaproteobacteria bacterium]|nr:hypothetical protein [Alphaproteobacteria bacterium]
MKAPAALAKHIRFYIALVCGVATWALCRVFGMDVALLAGGDVFYLVFLACCVSLVGQKAADLKKRAKSEDEGLAVVVLITLATALFFAVTVFTALNKKHGIETLPLVLAAIGAPLGWFVLHTVMAFHYADIHYFDDPDCAGDDKDLDFPGRKEPGPWDFLYFSFVIGMTAQVSDVQVKTSVMRRAVLLHGVASFFFNTVFIAMAVNAGVTLAS